MITEEQYLNRTGTVWIVARHQDLKKWFATTNTYLNKERSLESKTRWIRLQPERYFLDEEEAVAEADRLNILRELTK